MLKQKIYRSDSTKIVSANCSRDLNLMTPQYKDMSLNKSPSSNNMHPNFV